MYEIKEHLENRNDIKGNGVLYIGGVSCLELAEKYGTPLYAYDEQTIRNRYRKLVATFSKYYPKFKCFYAVKANNNLAVLKILKEEGAGLDCSCPAEIYLAEKAGFSRDEFKDKLLYSGVYLQNDELEFGVKAGVTMNLEDVSQIDRLVAVCKRLNKWPEVISFRINPGMGKGSVAGNVFGGKDAKFGIIEDQAVLAFKKAQGAGFKKFGIHMMTGSCVLDAGYFEAVTSKLLDICGKIRKELGIKFEFVDIGGGFGVSYRPGEKDLDLDYAAQKVAKVFAEKVAKYDLGDPELKIEPGRYIVCESGVLLTRVHSIKNGYKRFIGADAGMNTLLRPALYNAYHEIYVANKMNEHLLDDNAANNKNDNNASKINSKSASKKSTVMMSDKEKQKLGWERVNVCGQICENTDQFAKDRYLPHIEEGDLLALLNAGSYGFAMGSQYNNRPMCAEVLVNNTGNSNNNGSSNSTHELIRRRQGFEDLSKDMLMPRRLKGGWIF